MNRQAPRFKDQARSALSKSAPRFKDQVRSALPTRHSNDDVQRRTPETPDLPLIVEAVPAVLVPDAETHNEEASTRRIKRNWIRAGMAAAIAFAIMISITVWVALQSREGGKPREIIIRDDNLADPAVRPTKKVFSTTQELYRAVDSYLVNKSLTLEYGQTMNDWDVSQIRIFDRLFDPRRDTESPCFECAFSDFNENISN